VIAHDARLDSLIGTKQWRPFTRCQWINPDGSKATADVVDGEYVQSASTWPRTTARIVVPADPLVQYGGETPAGTPYGGRVRLIGGVRLWDGEEITYPINTLWVTSDAVERPDGTIEVEAASAEARVSDAGPYGTLDDFPQATTWHAITSVVRLVQDALGPVPYSYGALTANPRIAQYQYSNDDDRWALVEEIIGDAGGEAYFRHDGRLILRDIPYVGSPVAELAVGSSGTLTRYRKIRRWTKNRIKVAVYDSDGATLDYAIVDDDDPSSATYVGGPYGVHAELVKITTKATSVPSDTADRRARTIYRRRRSLQRRWELEAIPRPWLEVGDTVRIVTSSEMDDQLVESFRFPLSQLGAMSINTQAYTLAPTEG
jgi:hypothetical protein